MLQFHLSKSAFQRALLTRQIICKPSLRALVKTDSIWMPQQTSTILRLKSDSTAKDDGEDSGPVPFTKSEAFRGRPMDRKARLGIKGPLSSGGPVGGTEWLEGKVMPSKSQPMILIISSLIFLVYFCILREENDIDIGLREGSLFDVIEGLEKAQLQASILEYERRGMDTRAMKIRLKELEIEEIEKAVLKQEPIKDTK